MTYSVVKMPVPPHVYDFVHKTLELVGYDHCILGEEGLLDLTHIALVRNDDEPDATLHGFQQRVGKWVAKTFDEATATNVQERTLRLVEEAVELAQAVGVDQGQLHRLLDYVYSRPVGDPRQEVAGTMVTLAAAACSLELDLQDAALAEATRVETPEVTAKVQARQAEKRERLMTAPATPVARQDEPAGGSST